MVIAGDGKGGSSTKKLGLDHPKQKLLSHHQTVSPFIFLYQMISVSLH
jgi:hypothetical protein